MEILKEDNILIKNCIEKIKRGTNTEFLDPRELKLVISILKKEKINYFIYKAYDEAEKQIIYSDKEPNITVFKIISKEQIRHQDILGGLFALNIDSSVFGDIICKDSNYIIVLEHMANYIKQNIQIGKTLVTLEDVDISEIGDIKKDVISNNVIVPSLRIDAVLSKILGTNRSKILEIIKKKEVILNYQVLTNNSYILKDNDIFSVRKHGKYQYIGIDKKTKKDNYIILYNKYI